MAAFRAQIFGRSFVSRVKDTIRNDETMEFNFQLHDPALIQFTGFPGATIRRLQMNIGAISDFDPDLVFLIVGTNDLYNMNESPLSVASAIRDLVDTLLFSVGVRKVVVSQILHRTVPTKPTRYPVDVQWFNDRVNETNQLLREMLPTVHPSRATFWYHKGFWSCDAKSAAFSGDGVHLTHLGNKKLYYSIRASLVASLRGELKR